ncbi:Alpha/Beta hydrolase protein [Mycena leptocephala]|nr:Alpha/Beta hydrolase protein [Mycena leptocephala]
MVWSILHSTMALIALHNFLPAALIFLVWVGAVESATAPVVDLGYAQYEGVVDTTLNITAFRGIHYAAPPAGNTSLTNQTQSIVNALIGQLRWQATTPPSNASGIQQAYTDPPQCYQGAFGTALTNPLTPRDVEQSEDCLFLSVYSPALNSMAPLPTIVWIHGGRSCAFRARATARHVELKSKARQEYLVSDRNKA